MICLKLRYSPLPEGYSQELKDLVANCLQRDYKRRPNTTSLLQQSSNYQISKPLTIFCSLE